VGEYRSTAGKSQQSVQRHLPFHQRILYKGRCGDLVGSEFGSGLGEPGARIAQLVKAWTCNLWLAGSSPTVGRVFFWYGPLASLSLQIASVGSDHHAKKWRSQPVD